MIPINVAIIPARGGSKSIPLKNIKYFCGKPLIYWTVKAACLCTHIDAVYVATDHELIKETVENLGFKKAFVISRGAETATDDASTESVMLEFARIHTFDNIALIQATSPLLSDADLNGGFRLFASANVDSVLSVVRQKRFIWTVNGDGFSDAVNYDIYDRPRRQHFNGFLVENGAFYITSKEQLLKSRNRISGRIKTYEMQADTYFEIDEERDWIIAENLMKANRNPPYSLNDIRLVATDCDGVLTDAGMYYSNDGEVLKKFNTRDGHGFQLLKKAGIKTAIITAETNEIVPARGRKLEVDDILLGRTDKLRALKELCGKYALTLEQCAYIGDDVFDAPAIAACGFGCAPADACKVVLNIANYVCIKKGGNGAFREVVDTLVKS